MSEWWRGAAIYQVYVRSFFDTDGDGIGDLGGVIAKLDYIASLGVDGIWLSPFYPSPMKDFGYDVADYCDVDPVFGDLDQFDALLQGAHDRGLKVIIDQVWSHTSDRHPWFAESAASPDGPKADWYVWAEPKADGSPPNNWLAVFGGPSWTWGSRRHRYYMHNFLPEQPDLNYWNPEVQEAILNVARFWLDRGVDGFRLDVINCLFHDRELRNNPPREPSSRNAQPTQMQSHQYDRTRPEALGFVRRLRRLMEGYDQRMAVGEVFDEAALAVQQAYTTPPDGLHTAYSFYLLDATEATPALFATAIESWSGALGWPAWSLGNHDVARYPTRLAHGDGRLTRTLMAALLSLRGAAFLYQGEELGLPQADVPFARLRDPFAIAAYAGEAGRDGARTPMPWLADAPLCGFSTAFDAWLPVDPAHALFAADLQESDPASMLWFTRAILALRRGERTLREGRCALLPAPPGVLAFERGLGQDRIQCLFELTGRAAVFATGESAVEALSLWQGAAIEPGFVRLEPYSGALIRRPENRA